MSIVNEAMQEEIWIERHSGQSNQRGPNDQRDAYERDRTRAIHCPAFRRLQGKTQILGTKEGDFHRTRLTHSLEVASIGQSLVHSTSNARDLLPSDDLIQVICLLHDIGHPPFGHGGETALNFMMREDGGFEGNAQSLRVLTKTEGSYGNFGLDLTRRALLGILKYPVPYSKVLAKELPQLNNYQDNHIRINDWQPPKAYFDSEQAEIDWLLAPFSENDIALFQSLVKKPETKEHGKARFRSLDCSIMNIADDIAYGVHDLEDAIHLRLINRSQLDNAEFRALLSETELIEREKNILDTLFSYQSSERKQAIGELVNYFITATSLVKSHEGFENILLQYNMQLKTEAQMLLDYLIACIFQHVIDSQAARTFEYGGQTVIRRLFEAFSSNPDNLLDNKNRKLFHQAREKSPSAGQRIISDYIASMTDDYAYRMHERLFGFNTRTIFERL